MDNYEQKYNAALERAKEYHDNGGAPLILEVIFPELKESEDVRIKKTLIAFFRDWERTKSHCWNVNVSDILTWLEKQGEQKPTDKVEPKFNEGDWIISNNKKSIYQVIEVKRGIYVIRDNVDNHEYHIGIEECEKSGRLWNISDAKDGDVLCYQVPATAFFLVGIFKRVAPRDELYGGTYRNYAQYGGFGSIENYTLQVTLGNDELHHCGSIAYPATKKQRDLLFQKMKEAGYEWDAEKKALKKIEVISKESEDGRIRKELIEQVAYIIPNDDEVDSEGDALSTYQKRIDKYRAWLEKQGHMLDPDKVVEWIDDQACQGWIEDVEVDKFVDKFKEDFGL